MELSKTAKKAIHNLFTESHKYNSEKIATKGSTQLEQNLTTLDKDLSNPTNSQLQEMAKKQRKELEKMNKLPKMKNLNKAAFQLAPMLQKSGSVRVLKNMDNKLTKLLGMSKNDPKRAKLLKEVEDMSPEIMANNPAAAQTFMKVRDTITKTSEAKSKSQQRLMGMVHAYQNGELDNFSELDPSLQKKIKSMAKSMTKSESKDYAETKHKGLPEEKNAHFLGKFAKARTAISGVDDLVDAVRRRSTP